MTDVVDRSVRSPRGREVTEEGARARRSLNGAVMIRSPRPSSPGGDGRRRTARGGPTLEERVERLRTATVAELERRREGAGLEPADSLPVSVRELSSISRDLPRLAAEARHAVAAAAGAVRSGGVVDAVRAGLRFAAEQRRLAARPATGADTVDDFGFDREWTESLVPLFDLLYRRYWRVQVEGLENVPDEGRALLVSNHAGVLPYDGAMIRMACFTDHPAHRHARALILNAFFGMPGFSWFLRRTGNTLAHPLDAERLLEADELVLVFPEGAKGTGKSYRERYRLRRFGRGGFAQIAIRTGAPIIPVSVVGSEEIHPMVANLAPLADALGMPYFPVTPTFPLLGPLGLVPLPSSWVITFHEPIPTAGLGTGAAEDAGAVMALSDRVRDTIQAGLWAGLERRGSVFAR